MMSLRNECGDVNFSDGKCMMLMMVTQKRVKMRTDACATCR
jgi:hypothetical protein